MTRQTGETRGGPDLDALQGTWTGAGRLTFDGGDASVTVRWSVEPAAGGHGVVGSMSIEGLPGMPRREVTDLIGWDREEVRLHWVSICNAGEVHDRTGRWTGDVLDVEDARERVTARLASAGSLEIRWSMRDGTVAEVQLARA